MLKQPVVVKDTTNVEPAAMAEAIHALRQFIPGIAVAMHTNNGVDEKIGALWDAHQEKYADTIQLGLVARLLDSTKCIDCWAIQEILAKVYQQVMSPGDTVGIAILCGATITAKDAKKVNEALINAGKRTLGQEGGGRVIFVHFQEASTDPGVGHFRVVHIQCAATEGSRKATRQEPLVEFYDSLGNKDDQPPYHIHEIVIAMLRRPGTSTNKRVKYRSIIRENVQRNAIDCGYFSLGYVRCLLLHDSIPLVHSESIRWLRQLIAYEFIMSTMGIPRCVDVALRFTSVWELRDGRVVARSPTPEDSGTQATTVDSSKEPVATVTAESSPLSPGIESNGSKMTPAPKDGSLPNPPILATPDAPDAASSASNSATEAGRSSERTVEYTRSRMDLKNFATDVAESSEKVRCYMSSGQ